MDERIVAAVDRIDSDITESGLGKNGYLLSGQTAYLVSYTTGIEKMVQDIGDLRELLLKGKSTETLARLNQFANMANTDLVQSSRRMQQRGLMETRAHFRKLQARSPIEEITPFMKNIRIVYVRTHEEMEKASRRGLRRASTLFGLSFILFASFLGVTSKRMLEDISKVNKLVASLHHDAHHDSLTGLPNRAFVMEWLRYALSKCDREKSRLAILYIDLDKFKEINDHLGHDSGDLALVEVAKRFLSQLRGSDVLARLGGDEFVLLMSGFSEPEAPFLLGERLVKSLEEPIILPNESPCLGASIGIALFPEDGETPESLMKEADKAMYRSKELGGDRICFSGGAQFLRRDSISPTL
jgi:diguanylate cyclase (GGDEF)-like protein